MGTGLLFALAAGLMWGLVFVAPLLLADYPAALLVVGRHLAFDLLRCHWPRYPIRNADELRTHQDRSPRAWATAQGLVTLPMAMVALAALALTRDLSLPAGFDLPLGPRPPVYLALMLTIGLFASWLGTLCWNEASQRLPTALAGQLIVFEALSALAYPFALSAKWPPCLTVLGIALLWPGIGCAANQASARGR